MAGTIVVWNGLYREAYPTEDLAEILVEVFEPAYEIDEHIAALVGNVIQLVVRERVIGALPHLYFARAVVDKLFEGRTVVVYVPPQFVGAVVERRYHGV